VARNVSLNVAYEQLLLQVRFSRLTDAQNLLGVLVIIRNHLRNHPDALCTIYEMSQGSSRFRRLDEHDEIPNLFQGAAPVNPPERRGEIYPGDREIHADGQITIQIHTLELGDHSTGVVVFEDVVNLAIWVPEGIAGDVLIQQQGGLEES